ncbi:ACN9 family domain containing protein, putative [Cordyceps militaris CM01]|uniref:Succinate dehydrogenase assembly factor 3 n=2 Tax=Cordyceps militaris TaxID=73501 RepID=G3JN67_CORMM|nr:ACN9 family domain containing protein, putative [Cordyceps militaris CM01]ATY62091.1 ACN9 family domain containing [Cordyceps militaris]EGX90249.1 ACN9 family domain containing protein, putative [Cordyceps militaris CM01]
MRSSLAKLAKAASTQKGFRPEPMALLPPIPLYRRLLRAHRKFLPAEMRVLGDEYIKAEFRAHRKVDNPAHLVSQHGHIFKEYCLLTSILKIGFLTEWQMYAQKIEGDAWIGDKIDEGKLAKLSDEQVYQLYDLMQSIEKHRKGG